MKKLLTLAAAALLASSVANAKDWYLVGSEGVITKTVGSEDKTNANWTPNEEMCKFTDNGNGTYTWSGKKIDGEFKICDGSWDNSFGLDNCPNLNAGTYNLGYKKGNLKLHMNNPTITINSWQISYGNDNMEITISGDVIEQNNEKVVVTWNLTDDRYYYFFLDNNKEWDIPRIYTWNDELFGGWSGAKMSYMTIGEKEYCVARYEKGGGKEIKDGFGMIFTNDGNDNSKVEPSSPAPNVVYSNDDNNKGAIVGYIVNGEFSTTKPSEQEPEQPGDDKGNDTIDLETDKYDYYFFDDSVSKWNDVYIHFWGGDGITNNNDQWPGNKVEKYTFDGKQVYAFSFPKGKHPDGMIFNNHNAQKQTPDIKEFIPGTVYTCTDDWDGVTMDKGAPKTDVKELIKLGTITDKGKYKSLYTYNTELILSTNGVDLSSENGINHKDHVAVHRFTGEEGEVDAYTRTPFNIAVDSKYLSYFTNYMSDFGGDIEKLNSLIRIELEPGEWKNLHTFLKPNIHVATSDDDYDAPADIYTKCSDFEVTDDGILSKVEAEIAGDYKLTVKFDGLKNDADEYIMKPADISTTIYVKPTGLSLGLGLRYLGGASVENSNMIVLRTKYKDEDGNEYTPNYNQVYFSTAAHIPTRNIKFYYQIPQSTESGQANVKRRANETGAPEGYTEAGKEYLDFSHINGVQSGKVLSVVAEQNGVKSDPIDFNVADNIVTAVEGVEVEGVEAPARYFTLQGVEVSNLVPGIYIMVKGNVSSKILVK